MGTITTNFANGLTTNGVLGASTINDNSISNITSIVGGGALKLISSQTASASASISFTSGIDSSYRTYMFKFININPSDDGVNFQFNLSTDSGSNYNVTKTSTTFYAYHDEADTSTAVTYNAGADLAQSTAYQSIQVSNGSDADQALSGTLHLYNPSDTTFVKHFIANTSTVTYPDFNSNFFTAGYGNTTSAINAINFKFETGNFDGTIHMYGIA